MLRALLIVAVLLVAAAVAYLARRSGVYHPRLDISGFGFEPGLVIFTSTACPRCKIVLATAKSTGAPLREVTFELESRLQERLGVTGVPLTLVVDRSGAVAAQFAGLVGSRRLRRAIAAAGL